MMNWDAHQYQRYERERTLPARDLAHAIPLKSARRIIDVGCGIGNSTSVLHERFPDAKIIGADSSPAMLEAARQAHPDLTFIPFDAAEDFCKLEGSFDVVFSNACIQWIPDHDRLLTEMMGVLRPGGVLAVQIPMNHDEPIHQIITSLAGSDRWRGRFQGIPRVFHTLTQSEYYDILAELASDFSLWQTTYCHRMPSHLSIMEWYKGTGLRPYLAALPPQAAAEFEADVYREVKAAYPVQRCGEIIFRFPRFFFTATK